MLFRQTGTYLTRTVGMLALAVAVAHEEQVAGVAMGEALADTGSYEEAVLQELVFDGGHLSCCHQFLE